MNLFFGTPVEAGTTIAAIVLAFSAVIIALVIHYQAEIAKLSHRIGDMQERLDWQSEILLRHFPGESTINIRGDVNDSRLGAGGRDVKQ